MTTSEVLTRSYPYKLMGVDQGLNFKIVELPNECPHIVVHQNPDPDWDSMVRLASCGWAVQGALAHYILRVIYGDDYLDATEVVNFPYWEDRDVGGVLAAANECMQQRLEGHGEWIPKRGPRTIIPQKLLVKLEGLMQEYSDEVDRYGRGYEGTHTRSCLPELRP